MPQVPHHLVREVLAGNCVAFLGAGFSAAARLPAWDKLLTAMSSHGVAPKTQAHVAALVRTGSAHALDEAAQVLEEAIGRIGFVARIRQLLETPDLNETMARRLEWLRGIPFRAVLTTNFDPVLKGELPSPPAYRQVLRPQPFSPWEEAFWNDGQGAFVMKLHGAIELSEPEKQVVLTRRDYRHRLYEDHAYATFLRSVFASCTVLYLGFSFTDAYLNELRSEVLALLGHDGRTEPVAYAVVNDVPSLTKQHFLKTEGVQIHSYRSFGGRDHSGFDRWLQRLWEATNPMPRFARLGEGRRILWVDPDRRGNEAGVAFMERAAATSRRRPCRIDFVGSPEEAVAALRQARTQRNPFDLTITRWGGKSLTALRLMTTMRRQDLRCATLVFAGNRDVERRKRMALAAGAQAYCFRWERLFHEIERVFEHARQTG